MAMAMGMAMSNECARQDCGEPGVVYPMLKVWAKDYPHETTQPMEAHMNLPVCEAHQKSSNIDMLLSDEGWQVFVDVCKAAGRAEPDRQSVEIVWVPVHADTSPLSRGGPS